MLYKLLKSCKIASLLCSAHSTTYVHFGFLSKSNDVIRIGTSSVQWTADWICWRAVSVNFLPLSYLIPNQSRPLFSSVNDIVMTVTILFLTKRPDHRLFNCCSPDLPAEFSERPAMLPDAKTAARVVSLVLDILLRVAILNVDMTAHAQSERIWEDHEGVKFYLRTNCDLTDWGSMWFSPQAPFHALCIPVPIALCSNKNVLVRSSGGTVGRNSR